MTQTARPVYVRTYREHDPRCPADLRDTLDVTVDGQHVGAVHRDQAGAWTSSTVVITRSADIVRQRRRTHRNADAAVRTIARSALSRQIGTSSSSVVYWSRRAERIRTR